MPAQVNSNETLQALLVDGDQARAAACAEVLKNCGYTVVTAPDQNQALQQFARAPLDVVLSQEVLPAGSGMGLHQALLGAGHTAPFILLTDGETPAAQQARQAGAVGVFSTPKDLSALYPLLADAQAKSTAKPRESAKQAVHSVQLPELKGGQQKHSPGNVAMILDVPINVNAVLGTTTMHISELLQIGPGSVVELNKRAGDPVDIFVNEKLLAVGEVVVVNESFGVRITEVLDPNQRLQALA